jgi:hypothetical protein
MKLGEPNLQSPPKLGDLGGGSPRAWAYFSDIDHWIVYRVPPMRY